MLPQTPLCKNLLGTSYLRYLGHVRLGGDPGAGTQAWEHLSVLWEALAEMNWREGRHSIFAQPLWPHILHFFISDINVLFFCLAFNILLPALFSASLVTRSALCSVSLATRSNKISSCADFLFPGTIEHRDRPYTHVQHFTQADVNNGKIIYRPPQAPSHLQELYQYSFTGKMLLTLHLHLLYAPDQPDVLSSETCHWITLFYLFDCCPCFCLNQRSPN